SKGAEKLTKRVNNDDTETLTIRISKKGLFRFNYALKTSTLEAQQKGSVR
ncbi:16744_t:CDS:2, partial [Racocetra persica]